ncbi:hypothetical protein PF007_g10406, partial [Phytophthora fragariae]
NASRDTSVINVGSGLEHTIGKLALPGVYLMFSGNVRRFFVL